MKLQIAFSSYASVVMTTQIDARIKEYRNGITRAFDIPYSFRRRADGKIVLGLRGFGTSQDFEPIPVCRDTLLLISEVSDVSKGQVVIDSWDFMGTGHNINS